MSPDLEKTLADKYPELFINKTLPPTKSLMCFGCECGDGWYKILDHLFGYLTRLSNTHLHISYNQKYQAENKKNQEHKSQTDHKKNHFGAGWLARLAAAGLCEVLPPKIVLDQVKEKFGLLVIYYHITNEGENEGESKGESKTQNLPINQEEYNEQIKKYIKKIDHAIQFAQYQSSVTCEITGQEGKLYQTGWHRVLCEKEAKEKGYLPENDPL
jgi:hypothetical protein